LCLVTSPELMVRTMSSSEERSTDPPTNIWPLTPTPSKHYGWPVLGTHRCVPP